MEDFVSFEIAKKLKEKGFKEKCLAYYDIDDNVGLLYNTQYSDEYSPCQYTDLLQSHNTDTTVAQPDDSENCCDAPTISQVLKWLREEKRIVFGIAPMQEIDGDYLSWCATIYKVDDNGYGLSWQEELYYQTYETVAIAAIEYALDNLI